MGADSGDSTSTHDRRLPPKWLPVLYLGYAHACLGVATLLLAMRPTLLSEYHYQPRTIALVHLVTLGWITCSILGAIYLVGPIAFRRVIPATKVDALAFALVSVGVAGMVSHFWIDAYSGMLWAATSVLTGVAIVGWRVASEFRTVKLAWGYRLPVVLAFGNLLLAGALATLLGLEKLGVMAVPGFVLDGVYAHAHLAGVGWAVMLVVAVGYRLLPMMLPSAIPSAARVLQTTLLLQVGVLAFATALLARPGVAWIGAVVVLAGLGSFAADIRWMLGRRKRAPRALPRPDFATLQALQSIAYLFLAASLGGALLVLAPSPTTLRLGAVYGVLALVGFLAQVVVGVGGRLLPIVAWTRAFVGSGFERVPVSQFDMLDRRWQLLGLGAWSLGVPVLAVATFYAAPTWIAGSGWILFVGVLAEGVNRARLLRHARPANARPR